MTCQCEPDRHVNVTIVKHVPFKVYVPYTVYYDPARTDAVLKYTTTYQEMYNIAKRYTFIKLLKFRSDQLRSTFVHIKEVLKRLVVAKSITQESYEQLEKLLRDKQAKFELEISNNQVTLTSIEDFLKFLRNLISNLNSYGFLPSSICKVIGNKRVCGLHPNYFYFTTSSSSTENHPVFGFKKTYLKDKLFTRIIYTLSPGKVVSIESKDNSTGIIQFVRQGQQWSKKVVSEHEKVRTAVWSEAIKYIFANVPDCRETIQKALDIIEKNENAEAMKQAYLNSKEQKVKLLQQLLLKKYKDIVLKAVRQVLKTIPQLKELREKYPPTTANVQVPTKITNEIMKLPLSVVKLEDETLIQLLSFKFGY